MTEENELLKNILKTEAGGKYLAFLEEIEAFEKFILFRERSANLTDFINIG